MRNNKYENFDFDDSAIDELSKYISKKSVTRLSVSVSKGSNVKDCLSCQVGFESEGKHNRVCDKCRKENGF